MSSIWSPERPYQALPVLPPAVELETIPVLKQCVAARSTLAELKQACQLIPNPDILIRTLPLIEAQASSEIENVVTTTDRMFRQLRSEGRQDPATREALRYREALMAGFVSLSTRPLCTRTAEEICSRIKGSPMAVRNVPGTALSSEITGDVIYTPPVGEAVLRDKLANWERFLHGPDALDPLVRMAVGHYQFEAIHPFVDGNGRTGRVINSLFLVEAGLLPLPILYLSRYINAQRGTYYKLLLQVTRNAAWHAWLEFMLRAVETTARWTLAKVTAIRELAADTTAKVRRELPKIYSAELVEVLFSRPYCRIGDLVSANIAGRQAASRYLRALSEVGIVTEHRDGRDKLFVHGALLELLTTDDDQTTAAGPHEG